MLAALFAFVLWLDVDPLFERASPRISTLVRGPTTLPYRLTNDRSARP